MAFQWTGIATAAAILAKTQGKAMSKVINLFTENDVPTNLRNIADSIERGDLPGDGATLIIETDIFYLGNVPDHQAAANAIFDMNFGVHKLMNAVIEGTE